MTGPRDELGSGAPDEPVSRALGDVPPPDAPGEPIPFGGDNDATMRTEHETSAPPEAPAQFATEPERFEAPMQASAPTEPG